MILSIKAQQLLNQLKKVQDLAQASKWQRFVHHPVKYLFALGYRTVWYKIFRKEHRVAADLFFGKRVHLLLPSATDLFLTGGKTHSSEIRLARLLIRTLQPGQSVIDIGAHYGYFTLLASELVAGGGGGGLFLLNPPLKAFRCFNKIAVVYQMSGQFKKR
jgi:hypothetical protein